MINKNITDVRGFSARGAHIGIKSKRRDLALVVSDIPASAAGVFTQNRVIAHPLIVTKEHLKNGKAQALICTSGNANACNGKQGMDSVHREVKLLSELLKIDPKNILVGATGVIGEKFPIEKVAQGIKNNVMHMSKRRISGTMAANAIMTTDTFQKEAFATFKLGGRRVNMAGMAKGSGMIHPNMATMLGFIFCDADIEPELLQEALSEAVEDSFNMITVDGDTSTNDMVLIMSNGMAENKRITKRDADLLTFKRYLNYICKNLAMAIVSDGEGATKFIEYKVVNARNKKDAKTLIRTVSNSNLVKTAIFGRDPNWGRIIAAMGRSGVDIDPDKVNIFIGSRNLVQVALNGAVADFDKTRLKRMLRSTRIRIVMDVAQGNCECVGWGTDFSYEYVRINADYTT